MDSLTPEYIKQNIADSKVIYKRGESIFHLGNYSLASIDEEKKRFTYAIEGNYGEYTVTISVADKIAAECSCPYPYNGCKHIVAACLDLSARLAGGEGSGSSTDESPGESVFLTFEEMKAEVLENRKKSAKGEAFTIIWGEGCKGEHAVVTKEKKEYKVILHDLDEERGHCSCADFTHNRLNTCKHLIHVFNALKGDKKLSEQGRKETMPFIHVYWDSYHQKPRYYYDAPLGADLEAALGGFFDGKGYYKHRDAAELCKLLAFVQSNKMIKIDDYVINRVENSLFLKEMFTIKKGYTPDYSRVKTELYPYQKAGVEFCLFKTRAIIADEMGLGKTLQAITISLLKSEIFGFKRTLVICPASLKEQWKREIRRFTGLEAVIVSGGRRARQRIYESDSSPFLITNYEAVLRDINAIRRTSPEFVILDEAQRIKNFNTKTHQAILSVPRKQSLVITGTPLENKLEDLYAIVQFSDPELLSPFWIFSATYMKISKGKKKICGYVNLDMLKSQLNNLVIRRKKEDVLDSLPQQVTNEYYVDLAQEQQEIHQGYLSSLLPILNKKILTPFDLQMIQKLLLCMRMVCDSTFLIDEKTNISPKLAELESILVELVKDNRRKTVIFSEWTTMTYLIGKLLSRLEIPFVEFTGKVPVEKRQKLIEEFTVNPDCMVFLSSDAGGVGLNLQAADCVINFELPWNPAKLNQRIGRVNRIGQKSGCVNVVNLITKNSIEEKVAAGIALKQELFNAALEGEAAEVDFSEKKKAQFINRIRELFNEELVAPVSEKESVELEDDTPYYLNPEALEEDAPLDFEKEEEPVEAAAFDANGETDQTPAMPVMDPEKMEEVLGNGVKFLSGLSSLMSGMPLAIDEQSKAVTIDRNTGEVTLKFRMPGFTPKVNE